MKEQWRSSPRSPEQGSSAAQQPEAIPGVDAAPEEISHEETVCRGRGRPYGRARKLGGRALRGETVNKTKVRDRARKPSLALRVRAKRRAGTKELRYRRIPAGTEALVKHQHSGRRSLMTLKNRGVVNNTSSLKPSADRKGKNSRVVEPEYVPVGLTTPEYLEENFVIIRLPTPSRSLLTDE